MGWQPAHLPGHRTRPLRPRDGQPTGRRAALRSYLLSSGNWSSSAILNEPRRFFKGCPPRCIVGRRLSAREVRMRSSRPAAPAPARPSGSARARREGASGAAPAPRAGSEGGQGTFRPEARQGRARGARRQPRCARPRRPPRLRSLPARGPRCGCGNCRLFPERSGKEARAGGAADKTWVPGRFARRGLCPK